MRALEPLRLVGRGRRARRATRRPPPCSTSSDRRSTPRPAGRPPDDAPAGQHRAGDDLLPGDPDHVRRARPHRRSSCCSGSSPSPRRRRQSWTALDDVDVLADWHVGGRDARHHRAAAARRRLPRRVRRRCTSPCCCRPTRTYREEFADDVGPAVAPSSRRALRVPGGAERSATCAIDDDEPTTARHPPARRPGRAARVVHAVQPGVGHDDAARRDASCSGPSATPAATSPPPTSASRSSAGRSASSAATSTQPSLHSHITGILPGVRRTGLGRAMKLHQRAWAAEHGLAWVTWTFDPLVRRNAWFNIGVLGAEVHEYLVDFYGPIDDAINAGDESDRLLVAWAVDDGGRRPSAEPTRRRRSPCRRPRTSSCCAAPTRPTPTAWRRRLRARARRTARRRARRVVGFTRDGDYLVAAGGASMTARIVRAAGDPPAARQRRSRPASACRRAGASCSCGPRSSATAWSPRAGASASPATSRRTRRSTSTARRS